MEVKEKQYIITEEKNNSKINTKETSIIVYKPSFSIIKIFGFLSLNFIILLIVIYCIFSILNKQNNKIISGIYIQGIDVSGLTKEEAKSKISDYINNNLPKEIILKYNEYETSIPFSKLNISFNIDEAIDIAYKFGKDGNSFQNNLTTLKVLLSNLNINPALSFDVEELNSNLKDISSKVPNKMIESSCYIDGNNLIITKGSAGYTVNIDKMIDYIKENIYNLTFNNNTINLIVEEQYPTSINLDEIYNQIHKEPVNAFYTQNPFAVYPSENGVDFSISLEEAKNMLQNENTEYSIPLKIVYPEITTNMIGTEAFPDLLSDFSTNYVASNRNRTTNLILAANKINGTVIIPNETFSYNKVVGERTIQAGYKEAPIYVSGRVEDGLGGGICQITTTLYNAVLLANLEIVERSNHQFIPSYANASRDATVVYGAIDFKFKNNREYPIKITCSVSNGIANFKIFGLKSNNDFEVILSSRITGTNSTYIFSEGYKTLKKNGSVISSETISKDTYRRH